MENQMYANFIKQQEKSSALEVLHQTHYTFEELKKIYPPLEKKSFKFDIVKPVFTIEPTRPMFPSVVTKY
jgi:hypothetical protein